MTIARTALGTTSSKTSSTTLTISGVTVSGKAFAVVGVAWDDSVGNPTVAHAGNDIPFVVRASGGGNGVSCAIFARKRVGSSDGLGDLVVTFPSAVTAKAMVAVEFTDAGLLDIVDSNAQSAVTATNAGAAQTTNYANEICVGIFGAEGPTGDTAGAAQLGWTAGQRDGTTGDAADTNITIQETYKVLTATESARARLEVTTARDFTNCWATFTASQENNVGITPSDLHAMEELFNTNGYDSDDMVFHYNYYLGRWECYEVTDIGTLRAYQGAGWVEVV